MGDAREAVALVDEVKVDVAAGAAQLLDLKVEVADEDRLALTPARFGDTVEHLSEEALPVKAADRKVEAAARRQPEHPFHLGQDRDLAVTAACELAVTGKVYRVAFTEHLLRVKTSALFLAQFAPMTYVNYMASASNLLYGRARGTGPQPQDIYPRSWEQFHRAILASFAALLGAAGEPEGSGYVEDHPDVSHAIFDAPRGPNRYLRVIAVDEKVRRGLAFHLVDGSHSIPAPYVIDGDARGLFDFMILNHFTDAATELQLDFIDFSIKSLDEADEFINDPSVDLYSGSWHEPADEGFAGRRACEIIAAHMAGLYNDRINQDKHDQADKLYDRFHRLAAQGTNKTALQVLLEDDFGREVLDKSKAIMLRRSV